MRILLAHNFYQHPGGEDQVFAAEGSLLEQRGHTVIRLTRHNDDVRRMSSVAVASAALWNVDTYRAVRKVIREERIDVAHFHNIFPLISPAAYYAARSENVPVVQSLHNFRLICPGSLLYRDGRVCEDCLTRTVPWPGAVHSCYRGSAAQSAVVTGMLTFHRTIRTWSRVVDKYIALTEFARNKFSEGGLPAGKIVVKPNFLDRDKGPGEGRGNYALFVGRITKDKGVDVLLEAWRDAGQTIPLKVAGDGPMLDSIARRAAQMRGVEILGPTRHSQVLDLMKDARVLIVPSLWYEGLPMTIVEAFAAGLPVIASDLGSLSSVVEDGVNGARFRAGDGADLARTVKRILSDLTGLSTMRANARASYEQHYSAASNYTALMNVYEAARRTRGYRTPARAGALSGVTTN